MCGIGGFICTAVNQPEKGNQILSAMGTYMVQRGPDNEGHWFDGTNGVGLVHRRLKIIDLSDEANQPMILDNQWVMVFNGEIYNYKELKQELLELGIQFFTESDSEVLLKGFALWGEKILNRLDGMFAFAIWNKISRELFCARDRFGEKPFFYFNDAQNFVFASRIESIVRSGLNLPVEADHNKLNAFLLSGLDYFDDETFYRNIFQLKPGHFMRYKNGKKETVSYYAVPMGNTLRLKTDAEYIENFRHLFDVSVKRRMRSDVKVGTSLSGGLDSSVVVSYIAAYIKKDILTVSARFPGSEKDEGKWIQEVVSRYQVPNFEVFPQSMDLLDSLKKITSLHGRPLGSSSVFAQYKVMETAASNGCRVMLDGQGADEIMAGYKPYRQLLLWEYYRKGKFRAFIRERRQLKQIHPEISTGYTFLFDPVLLPAGIKRKPLLRGTTARKRMHFDLLHDFRVLLDYADSNSMAHSVEVRLPFLFHELVEFMFSLPVEMYYRNGQTKWIMREAMKSVLPSAIYLRKDKVGYEPPQHTWLQQKEFKELTANAELKLQSMNLSISSSKWRNIAATVFLDTV